MRKPDHGLLLGLADDDHDQYGLRVDHAYWNGSFLERTSTTISESGGVVTMSIEASAGGDLTMRFSDGRSILDCTPAQTINLTVGTDPAPQMNYVYILRSDKILALSTTAYPTTVEHIRIGTFYVPSAVHVAARSGTIIHQAWNDAAAEDSGQGHGLKVMERERRSGALWFQGLGPDGTSDYLTLDGTTVDFAATTGIVYQMHDHAIDAFDTALGEAILVTNWFEDAFHEITNLFDIVDDSTGTAIGNNKWIKIVLWAVVSGGDFHPYMLNLPNGIYNTQAAAELDLDNTADYGIPREFLIDSSTGILVTAIVVQVGTSSWTFGATQDLRGIEPALAGATHGGVSSAPQMDIWIPTYEALTIGNGVVEARFQKVGNVVWFYWSLVFGTTSTMGAQPRVSFPIEANLPADDYGDGHNTIGTAAFDDATADPMIGVVHAHSSTFFKIKYITPAGAGIRSSNVGATSPFTWTTDDRISVQGSYEVA